MGFGPSYRRHRPGQRSLSSRRLNAPLGLLERLENLRGGYGVQWSPAGPLLRGAGTTWMVGTTPSDGIPARDTNGFNSADITECSLQVDSTGRNATLQTWGDSTFIGFNLSSQDVAGDALTLYVDMFGLWVCVWEDCPASS